MMFFIEQFTLGRAWTGLTDEELMWEPADGSWGVRPAAECRTPNPFISGDLRADFDGAAAAAGTAATGEPLTTIAWLFWHVGSMPGRAAELDFLGGTHTAASGWTSPYLTEHPMYTRADAAVASMQSGWRELNKAVRSASDDDLERPTAFWGYGGPGPMATGAQILASVLNEVDHHGTQIGVLRDFFRVRAAT
jgi:hypothetical protein